jgi:hypothetical protein
MSEYLDARPNVPAPIADDDILSIARMAEQRIEAIKKIKQVALSVTNAADWTDQQDRPYLQASGSEKVANLFDISWGFATPEPVYEEDRDGHYTYTFRGWMRMGTRTIELEGSRSSRDPFFVQYRYEGEGKDKKRFEIAVEDRNNKRDVRMAALTNFLGNGITRILGIRNLSWDDLQAFAGIKKDDVRGIQYKKKGESPTNGNGGGISDPAKTVTGANGEHLDQKQMQMEISRMLMEQFGSEEAAATELERLTTWTNKEGKTFAGKKSPFELNIKTNANGQTQTSVTFHQVRDSYQKWQKENGQANA